MRAISQGELRAHNGDGGSRLWVAQAGMVYDVTDCPKWRTGMHERDPLSRLGPIQRTSRGPAWAGGL